MAEIRCAYGFSCAAMMIAPGLSAADCPNKDTCGTIRVLTGDETVDLRYGYIENGERAIAIVSLTSREAALRLLRERGCPQTPASLGVADALARLRSRIAELEQTIADLNADYIAPSEVNALRYSVKRPWGTYQYNKLLSKSAIFPPQQQQTRVKDLHLSVDRDWRNIEGRAGIERRNRLLAIVTLIEQANRLLDRASDTGSGSIADVVESKIRQGESDG
jgi:hypothetical protein